MCSPWRENSSSVGRVCHCDKKKKSLGMAVLDSQIISNWIWTVGNFIYKSINKMIKPNISLYVRQMPSQACLQL